MAESATEAHQIVGGARFSAAVPLAEAPPVTCTCGWEGPVTEWASATHSARILRMSHPAVAKILEEHAAASASTTS
jgi:hypothetical protein